MDTTVIECRNKTASILQPENSNGDWTTNLKESIAIYKGDQIACRNVFVDTKALQAGPNTKIPIPKTLKLSLSYYLYNVNWEGANPADPDGNNTFPDSSILPINAAAGVYDPKNDGKIYVACEEIQIPPTVQMAQLRAFDFRGVFAFQTAGGFTAAIIYQDATGTDQVVNAILPGGIGGAATVSVNVDFKLNGDPSTPTGTLGSPIGLYVANQDGSPNYSILLATFTRGNLTYNGGKFYKDTAVYALNTFSRTITTETQYRPKLFTTEIEVEGGDTVAYDPVDLCQYINRKLTAINPATVTESELTGDNKFLQHVGLNQPAANAAFNYFIPVITGTENGGDKFGYKYNTNGTVGARWVGASQIELSYDPTLKKFSWDFLHTPLLDSGSLSVAMIRRQQHPAADFITVPINKNGGILLNNLSAQEKDSGEINNFWNVTLGFGSDDGGRSLNYMLNSYGTSGTGADGVAFEINGAAVSLPVFNNPIVDGTNVTGGFQGIDSVLQKQASNFNVPPTLPTTATPPAQEIFSTSNKQIEIEALTSTLNSKNEVSFGYFLVEVQTKFTTRMLTDEQSHRNRVAIVSRYYQQDSYTSAAGDASIVYIHNSDEPLYINSFKCRILDSDGNLATVGRDNTLFLQVVRALPLPQQLPLPAPQGKEKENEKV
jgi:hypothetical protein